VVLEREERDEGVEGEGEGSQSGKSGAVKETICSYGVSGAFGRPDSE
jgi:hypothetical protein